MTHQLDRLSAALADRSALEWEIGSGAKVTMPERLASDIQRMTPGARRHLLRSVTDTYGASGS